MRVCVLMCAQATWRILVGWCNTEDQFQAHTPNTQSPSSRPHIRHTHLTHMSLSFLETSLTNSVGERALPAFVTRTCVLWQAWERDLRALAAQTQAGQSGWVSCIHPNITHELSQCTHGASRICVNLYIQLDAMVALCTCMGGVRACRSNVPTHAHVEYICARVR